MDSVTPEDKTDVVCQILCMACLCVGRSLHELTDERTKKFYFDSLNEIPLSNMLKVTPTVCWECKAMLKKLAAFKEQVKDSYRVLNTYCHETLEECLIRDVVRPSRLEIYRAESVSIIPTNDVRMNHKCESNSSINREVELVKDELVMKNELQVDCFKEELLVDCKIDGDTHDDNVDSELCPTSERSERASDLESNMPTYIADLKKRKTERIKKIAKHNRVKKITKSVKSKKKHLRRTKNITQNIITIELSYEDMLKERERDSTKESYLKAEYKCSTCLIGFNYNRSYKAHLETKHLQTVGNYRCPICDTVVASLESFTAHYKRHMRRYECGLCHKRTIDLKMMQQHYYTTHEISLKQYKCNLCGKLSNSIDTHRYHRDSHKARVQCPDCEKTFSHRAGLMNHRLTVHELRNEFPCGECGKVFRWKTSLKRHVEKHDAKNKLGIASAAYCSPCGVSFTTASSYQRHLKNSLNHVTQDQLRFTCDHCHRRFADKTKLRDHIEEKHLHKTFQCQICLKVSKNRAGLDQHIRNVHKGRPNNKICHHCGKGFPTKVQLESHIRTHTGERPFICEHCPTTFSQQSNLYKHYRQVHLNIKSKKLPINKKKPEKERSETLREPVEAPVVEDLYARPVTVIGGGREGIWGLSPMENCVKPNQNF